MKENENVNMSCSVRYEGAWAPSIHWYVGNNTSVFEQRVTAGIYDITKSSHVTSLLTLNAKESHHGHNYKCVILFDNSTGLLTVNQTRNGSFNVNIPSYNHKCNVPALNVLCK